MYRIILGEEFPTDSQLGIVDTDNGQDVFFEIESTNWKILSCWWNIPKQKMIKAAKKPHCQTVLKTLLYYND